jgi:Na+/melibiose symporter-like transporter
VCVQSITGVPQETLSVLARAGPLIVLYLLGFKDDGGADHNSQNKNVEFALKAMAGGIPLVVSLISLLLLQWYNIDEVLLGASSFVRLCGDGTVVCVVRKCTQRS